MYISISIMYITSVCVYGIRVNDCNGCIGEDPINKPRIY